MVCGHVLPARTVGIQHLPLFLPFHSIRHLVRLGPDTACVRFGVRPWIRGPLFTPNRSVGRVITLEPINGAEPVLPEMANHFLLIISKSKSIRYSILSLQVVSLSSATLCCYSGECCCKIKNISLANDPSTRPDAKLSKKAHLGYSVCFILCFEFGCAIREKLTYGIECYRHGEMGKVYGTDCLPITIHDCLLPFSQQSSRSLNTKPKLFFIQACQGDQHNISKWSYHYQYVLLVWAYV